MKLNEYRTFGSWAPHATEIFKAAQVALGTSLAVQRGERVLIVSNPSPEVSTIAMALYDAAAERGGLPVLLYQPVKTQLEFAAEETLAALRAEPEVVISLSAEKFGKDRHSIARPLAAGGRRYDSLLQYLIHGVERVRSFWSPGVTTEIFSRSVPLDYARLKQDCAAVKEVLDRAVRARIRTPFGTDLELGLEGRRAYSDDGDFSRPGTGGNLPAGESYISPTLGSAEGILVYDGSIATHKGSLLIKTPIRLEIRNGRIQRINGGPEADELEETLSLAEERAYLLEREGKLGPGQGEVYAGNVRGLGELGIGLNPKAVVTGNMLEDEKAFRTCHLAIGSNYDNDAPALIHLDGIVSRPTIEVVFEDGGRQTLLLDGDLAL